MKETNDSNVTIMEAEPEAMPIFDVVLSSGEKTQMAHIVNEYGAVIPCDPRALEAIQDMKKQMRQDHMMMTFMMLAIFVLVWYIVVFRGK